MAEKGDSMDEPTQTRRADHLDGKFHPFLCSQNELRKALSKHSFDWDFRPCTLFRQCGMWLAASMNHF